jgi:Dolichyl-phosphate-mannose-protein mannosyltransferase
MTPAESRWTTRHIVFALLAAQIVAVFFFCNGPSADEGIYAWVGMRQAESFPLVYGERSLNGSPWIWPWIAAASFRFGGLIALRLTAVALSTGAFALTVDATRRLFGDSTAFGAAAALALNGAGFALGHLGVYDVPALAATSLSFWCISCLATEGGARWVVGAALAAGLGVICKYAYVFMGPVLFAAMLAVSRSRVRHALLFLAIASAIVMGHDKLILGTWLPVSYSAYRSASVKIGRAMVGAEQLYFFLPVLLGLIGYYAVRRDRESTAPIRILAYALLAPLFVWPIFHIVANTAQAANKHVVAGALLSAPLAGIALRNGQRLRKLVLPLAAWGALQWITLEYSWVDARPAIDYLVSHVGRSDRIMSNAGTFRFVASLHVAGIDGRFSEFANPPEKNIDAEWVVWEDSDSPESLALLARLRHAGMRDALEYRSRFVGADAERAFGLHAVSVRILHREVAAPGARD